MKEYIYKIIGAERFYKRQVSNRARAWGQKFYKGSDGFRMADDFFKWSTGIDLRHIPDSSRDRDF